MNKQNTISEWTNFLEVRAFGLMRSGNHTIIEWIQNQHSSQITCFLNNVKHGNYDPYTSYEQKVITGVDEQTDIEILRKMKKRLLIYSYEDRHNLEFNDITFFESVFQQDFEENRQTYLGASEHQFDIMIIRDPFNLLASRLMLFRVRGSQGGVSDPEWIIRNWKILAREAIKLIKNPQPNKIVAKFNQWASDPAYRQHLSQLLRGAFDDSAMDNIPQFGGGSSFRDFDRLTTSMIIARWRELFNIRRYTRLAHYWRRFTAPDHKKQVFERWKFFIADEKYRKLVFDSELLDLSEKLFGEIPGIREFVKL